MTDAQRRENEMHWGATDIDEHPEQMLIEERELEMLDWTSMLQIESSVYFILFFSWSNNNMICISLGI